MAAHDASTTIDPMTPDDLAAVHRSWTQLRAQRAEFQGRLEDVFATRLHPDTSAARARHLIEAADELVGLLATPSRMAMRARAAAASWGPVAGPPDIDGDGAAWLQAASEVCSMWSSDDEVAWRRAWLLLGEVVAAETLAPFTDPPASASDPT
jgi:hypothetical protein